MDQGKFCVDRTSGNHLDNWISNVDPTNSWHCCCIFVHNFECISGNLYDIRYININIIYAYFFNDLYEISNNWSMLISGYIHIYF